MDRFPAGTERHVVAHAGHFMPREQPHVVVDALLKLAK
jgi:pimeloyl-ACP methyl ester carboxylesterase